MRDTTLAAAAANPFRAAEGEGDGKTLHLFFLETTPGVIDGKRLNALRSAAESWKLVGRVFYLHAPDGFQISKLAAGAERILRAPATARNWRTVSRIGAIARQFP